MGIGARDKTLSASSAEGSSSLGCRWLSREAHYRGWACALSFARFGLTSAKWLTELTEEVCALGVETLLPRLEVERLMGGSARIMVKPLFPGYFFARFCPENALESVDTRMTSAASRQAETGCLNHDLTPKLLTENSE